MNDVDALNNMCRKCYATIVETDKPCPNCGNRDQIIINKKCPKCGKLTPASHRVVMCDLDEDATEGQVADYYSGLSGDWGVDEYSGVCIYCKSPFILQEM